MKAIILAAGCGTRLLPMTINKPKPLLEIRGKSILENMIFHLRTSGVQNIIVVTGYKHQAFDELARKLKFQKVVLEDYEGKNSATSLQLVCDEIESGTLILNGDLYITHSFFAYLKYGVSQFLAQKIAQNSPSWGYITDENDKIVDIDTHANSGFGDGIAFLDNPNDIDIFKASLLECDEGEYWECAVQRLLDKIDFYAFHCEQFYIEIDSFYNALSNHLITPEEIAIQCSDDGQITRLQGITNTNYKITFLGKPSVIRIPGKCTNYIIDRAKEKEILDIISGQNITPKSDFYQSGIKISPFLQDYRCLSFDDIKDKRILALLVDKIKILHCFKHKDYPQFTPILLTSEIQKYEDLAHISLTTKQEHKVLLDIARKIDSTSPLVLCHRDLQLPNILFNGKDLQFIDFEYAGFSSIIWELGNLSAELELDSNQIQTLIKMYGEINKRDIIEGQLIANYIWALWGWIYERIDLGREYLTRFHNNLKYLLDHKE